MLQVFIYFGGWWDVFYYVLNILVFSWKGMASPEQLPQYELTVASSDSARTRELAQYTHTRLQVFTCPTLNAILTWSIASRGSGS